MAQIRWDVKVEIVGFLIECCSNEASVDSESQIHEVNISTHGAHDPFQLQSQIVEILLKLLTLSAAVFCVVPEPESKEVINELAEKQEYFSMSFCSFSTR